MMRPFKILDESVKQANRLLSYSLAAYCFIENGRRLLLPGDSIDQP